MAVAAVCRVAAFRSFSSARSRQVGGRALRSPRAGCAPLPALQPPPPPPRGEEPRVPPRRGLLALLLPFFLYPVRRLLSRRRLTPPFPDTAERPSRSRRSSPRPPRHPNSTPHISLTATAIGGRAGRGQSKPGAHWPRRRAGSGPALRTGRGRAGSGEGGARSRERRAGAGVRESRAEPGGGAARCRGARPGRGGGARPGVRVPAPSATARGLARRGAGDACPLQSLRRLRGPRGWKGREGWGRWALPLPGSGEGIGAKPTLTSGFLGVHKTRGSGLRRGPREAAVPPRVAAREGRGRREGAEPRGRESDTSKEKEPLSLRPLALRTWRRLEKGGVRGMPPSPGAQHPWAGRGRRRRPSARNGSISAANRLWTPESFSLPHSSNPKQSDDVLSPQSLLPGLHFFFFSALFLSHLKGFASHSREIN